MIIFVGAKNIITLGNNICPLDVLAVLYYARGLRIKMSMTTANLFPVQQCKVKC